MTNSAWNAGVSYSTQNDLDKDGAILNRVKSGIAHQKHDMALNCSTPRVVKIDLDKYFNDEIKELKDQGYEVKENIHFADDRSP